MAGRKLGASDPRHVHAVLSEDVATRARALASKTGHSLSSIVNRALGDYLARIEQMDAAIDMITGPAGGK